jgi:hypothetical protein
VVVFGLLSPVFDILTFITLRLGFHASATPLAAVVLVNVANPYRRCCATDGVRVLVAQPGGGDYRRAQRYGDGGGQRVQSADQQALALDLRLPERGAPNPRPGKPPRRHGTTAVTSTGLQCAGRIHAQADDLARAAAVTGMDGRPAPGGVYGLVVTDRTRPAVPGTRAIMGPVPRRWARPVMNASA